MTIELALLPARSQVSSTAMEPAKAAIVDQLYSLQPKQDFIQQTTQELEDYGFGVNLHSRLPGHGYEVIVFRADSGLLGSEGKIIKCEEPGTPNQAAMATENLYGAKS